MKRSIIKFIFVLTVSLILFTEINAQLCGSYTTSLQINDTNGERITNAVVQLLPVEKDETRGKIFVRDETLLNVFSISFFEGHQLSANYKLLISAEGYKTFETEIKFPHCKKRHFDLVLEPKDSESKNSFEEMTVIIFTMSDDYNSDDLIDVKTTVTGEDGKTYEGESGDNGHVMIKVINKKKYKVRFEKSGYKTKEIEIDLSKSTILYEPIEMEKQ